MGNDIGLIRFARQLAIKKNICEIQMNMIVLDIKQGRLRNEEEITERILRSSRRK